MRTDRVLTCFHIGDPTGTFPLQTAAHPGWDGQDEAICKAYGAAWHAECRSALLIVPSLPARLERNFLINPAHPDANGITRALPEPVWWDARLYRQL